MSEEIALVKPNTAEEALELMEKIFVDKIEREPLMGLYDYGVLAGQQIVIDYLRGVLHAEAINEEDGNATDERFGYEDGAPFQ